MSDTIKLELSKKQLEDLYEALDEVQDCGPVGSGWASSAVMDLRDIVEDAMKKNNMWS